MLNRKLPSFLAAAGLAVAVFAVTAGTASAAGLSRCNGGTTAPTSIAPGTYDSLEISGFCQLDSGNVRVKHNLTILPGGGLNAAFSGSNLTVGGDVRVQRDGILILGCEPNAFPCFNDPNGNTGGTPGMQTNDTIGHNLIASDAMMVLLHRNRIGGSVTQQGGGGGVTCASQPLGPNGPPAYTTYEDNVIGGRVSIRGLRTCWAGFFRNDLSSDLSWRDNLEADEDGNEIATNNIEGNLSCSGNDPAPQLGDSVQVGNTLNTVQGDVSGQCVGLAFPHEDNHQH
jgi:hypothetical protein